MGKWTHTALWSFGERFFVAGPEAASYMQENVITHEALNNITSRIGCRFGGSRKHMLTAGNLTRRTWTRSEMSKICSSGAKESVGMQITHHSGRYCSVSRSWLPCSLLFFACALKLLCSVIGHQCFGCDGIWRCGLRPGKAMLLWEVEHYSAVPCGSSGWERCIRNSRC